MADDPGLKLTQHVPDAPAQQVPTEQRPSPSEIRYTQPPRQPGSHSPLAWLAAIAFVGLVMGVGVLLGADTDSDAPAEATPAALDGECTSVDTTASIALRTVSNVKLGSSTDGAAVTIDGTTYFGVPEREFPSVYVVAAYPSSEEPDASSLTAVNGIARGVTDLPEADDSAEGLDAVLACMP